MKNMIFGLALLFSNLFLVSQANAGILDEIAEKAREFKEKCIKPSTSTIDARHADFDESWNEGVDKFSTYTQLQRAGEELTITYYPPLSVFGQRLYVYKVVASGLQTMQLALDTIANLFKTQPCNGLLLKLYYQINEVLFIPKENIHRDLEVRETPAPTTILVHGRECQRIPTWKPFALPEIDFSKVKNSAEKAGVVALGILTIVLYYASGAWLQGAGVKSMMITPVNNPAMSKPQASISKPAPEDSLQKCKENQDGSFLCDLPGQGVYRVSFDSNSSVASDSNGAKCDELTDGSWECNIPSAGTYQLAIDDNNDGVACKLEKANTTKDLG